MPPFTLLESAPALRVSSTLIHFLWQGALAALFTWMALRCVSARGARFRYTIAVGGLFCQSLAPFVTFAWLSVAGNDPMRDRALLVSTELQLRSADDLGAPASAPLLAATAAESVPAWQPLLLVVWAGGVVLLSLRLLVGVGYAQWLRCTTQPVPAPLSVQFARLAERFDLRTGEQIRVSPSIGEAFAVGCWRPLVLLPSAWLTELRPEVLEAIVAHEFSHIRRWDLWVNLWQRLVETLLFYHPAIWWLSRQVRLEREMCCDELAVQITGERVIYAHALKQAAEQRGVALRPTFAAALKGEDGMSLLRRVRNVLGMSHAEQRAGWGQLVLLAALIPLGAVTTSALLPGVGTPVLADDGPRDRDRPNHGEREREDRERGRRRERDGDRERDRDGNRDRDRGGNRERLRDREPARDRDFDRDHVVREYELDGRRYRIETRDVGDGRRRTERVERIERRRVGDVRPPEGIRRDRSFRPDADDRAGGRERAERPLRIRRPFDRDEMLLQMIRELKQEVAGLREEIRALRARPAGRSLESEPRLRGTERLRNLMRQRAEAAEREESLLSRPPEFDRIRQAEAAERAARMRAEAQAAAEDRAADERVRQRDRRRREKMERDASRTEQQRERERGIREGAARARAAVERALEERRREERRAESRAEEQERPQSERRARIRRPRDAERERPARARERQHEREDGRREDGRRDEGRAEETGTGDENAPPEEVESRENSEASASDSASRRRKTMRPRTTVERALEWLAAWRERREI